MESTFGLRLFTANNWHTLGLQNVGYLVWAGLDGLKYVQALALLV